MEKLKYVKSERDIDETKLGLVIDVLLRFAIQSIPQILNRNYRAHFIDPSLVEFALNEMFLMFGFSQLPFDVQKSIKKKILEMVDAENQSLTWQDVRTPWESSRLPLLMEELVVYTPTPQPLTPGSGLVSSGTNVAIAPSKVQYSDAVEDDDDWTPVGKKH